MKTPKTAEIAKAPENVGLTFGSHEVRLGSNLYGLLNIDEKKSYYTTAQTIVQTANGVAMVADIATAQCSLFADAMADKNLMNDYETLEKFIDTLQLPQFYTTDENGERKFRKQTVSQMCAAGIVYNDSDAPDSLKTLPWSVLGALGSIIRKADKRKILYEDIRNGGLEIKTQKDARDYAREHSKKKPTEADTEESKKKPTEADTEESEQATDKELKYFLLEVVKDGVFVPSYTQDGSIVTFGLTNEEAQDALANMCNACISEAVCTLTQEMLDGRFYGAIITTQGDATAFRLTPVSGKSVFMPTAVEIAALRTTRETLSKMGKSLDPEYDLILEIADLLKW